MISKWAFKKDSHIKKHQKHTQNVSGKGSHFCWLFSNLGVWARFLDQGCFKATPRGSKKTIPRSFNGKKSTNPLKKNVLFRPWFFWGSMLGFSRVFSSFEVTRSCRKIRFWRRFNQNLWPEVRWLRWHGMIMTWFQLTIYLNWHSECSSRTILSIQLVSFQDQFFTQMMPAIWVYPEVRSLPTSNQRYWWTKKVAPYHWLDTKDSLEMV